MPTINGDGSSSPPPAANTICSSEGGPIARFVSVGVDPAALADAVVVRGDHGTGAPDTRAAVHEHRALALAHDLDEPVDVGLARQLPVGHGDVDDLDAERLDEGVLFGGGAGPQVDLGDDAGLREVAVALMRRVRSRATPSSSTTRRCLIPSTPSTWVVWTVICATADRPKIATFPKRTTAAITRRPRRRQQSIARTGYRPCRRPPASGADLHRTFTSRPRRRSDARPGCQIQPASREMRMASMRLRAPTLVMAFDR